MENQKPGIRLNKYMADSGYCSRREADRLISEGRVRIDGSSSDWLFGITPKMANFPDYDRSDRLIRPLIRSADFTINVG